jgi:cytochrome b561
VTHVRAETSTQKFERKPNALKQRPQRFIINLTHMNCYFSIIFVPFVGCLRKPASPK